MKNFLLIKYFFTGDNPQSLFEQMALKIEKLLEEKYKSLNVCVFFKFIKVYNNNYYQDIMEIDHTFPLDKDLKKDLVNELKKMIYFYDDYEKKYVGMEKDFLGERSHLEYVKFSFIDSENLVLVEK